MLFLISHRMFNWKFFGRKRSAMSMVSRFEGRVIRLSRKRRLEKMAKSHANTSIWEVEILLWFVFFNIFPQMDHKDLFIRDFPQMDHRDPFTRDWKSSCYDKRHVCNQSNLLSIILLVLNSIGFHYFKTYLYS